MTIKTYPQIYSKLILKTLVPKGKLIVLMAQTLYLFLFLCLLANDFAAFHMKKQNTFSFPLILSPGTCLALDNGMLTMRQAEAGKNTCSLTCLPLPQDYA